MIFFLLKRCGGQVKQGSSRSMLATPLLKSTVRNKCYSDHSHCSHWADESNATETGALKSG
jgi:hypothetical protein